MTVTEAIDELRRRGASVTSYRAMRGFPHPFNVEHYAVVVEERTAFRSASELLDVLEGRDAWLADLD